MTNFVKQLYEDLFFHYQTSWHHEYDSTTKKWKMKFVYKSYLQSLHLIFKTRILGKKEKLVFNFHKRAKPKTPRIIHIIGKIGGLGGSQKIIFDLMNHLGEDYDMETITLSDYLLYDYPQLKIEYIPNPTLLKKYILKRKPNIIHLHYYGDWYGFHSALNVILKLPNSIKIIENVNTPIQAFRHPRISQYIYVSKLVKDLQSVKRGIVIYPGVDTNEFTLDKWSGKFMTAGFVYRLFKDKLNDDSIKTLVKVARMDKRIRIIIVGYGEYFRRYFKIIKKSGRRNQFEFVGKIDYKDLDKYYRKFQVFLAPVYNESYGLVVPYAMSMGIPIVANAIGALPEILGNTNFLAKNDKDFSRISHMLLTSQSRSRKIGIRGRQRIIAKFSLQLMLQQYNNLYQKLVQ